MATDLLKRLDEAIEAKKSVEREAREKAVERRNELKAKGDEIDVSSEEFKSATEELDGLYQAADTAADELTELKSRRAVLARTEGAPAAPEDGKGFNPDELAERLADRMGGSKAKGVDFAKRIVEGQFYKALDENGVLRDSVDGIGGRKALGEYMNQTEFKALISRASDSAGAFIEFEGPQKLGYDPLLQQPIDILPLLTTIPVSTDSVKYMQQLTAGHNVKIIPDPTTAQPIGSGDPAVTPEQAGLKPESSYTWTEKTALIETLAHTLPIHKNQLADVPQLRALLDGEMRYGLLKFLQAEVIAGDGSTGHLRGVLNTTGIISQAKGSDSVIDALHKVVTGVRLTYNEPTGFAMHPTNWEQIRLLKDANGNYQFGPPSQSGATTLWGKPVVVSTAIPLNKPIAGDWSYAHLLLREGVSMAASDSHADFFIRNLIMLLAEMRAGFYVRRPAAFGTVTGI